jgi:hypothetical protein
VLERARFYLYALGSGSDLGAAAARQRALFCFFFFLTAGPLGLVFGLALSLALSLVLGLAVFGLCQAAVESLVPVTLSLARELAASLRGLWGALARVTRPLVRGLRRGAALCWGACVSVVWERLSPAQASRLLLFLALLGRARRAWLRSFHQVLVALALLCPLVWASLRAWHRPRLLQQLWSAWLVRPLR